MKKTLILLALILASSQAFAVGDNQFYTYAEVFESAPVHGKSSLDCITCPDVLLGYKLGIRLVQRTKTNDLPIIFDVVSKEPIAAGTWIKVGIKMNLVTPIKTAR
ncbi:hypothetical protein RJO15_21045 [Herbaspirillum huttiense F1]|uniref:hypothetical protein n=1 Tax=Herbaspirillum TaxID=963 RepID=UPI001600C831|nr:MULTISPECIES: hypothetical protein [Herbaspirillum]MDR6742028.1 hypothetical protein [Herbaspirillum sp. 1173]MDT0358288.1 hypothetical protein [Herbaspirillum huttiense F1]QNB05767.1 hypothetical protein G5S34_02545 [Herbaspirillum frisingense]